MSSNVAERAAAERLSRAAKPRAHPYPSGPVETATTAGMSTSVVMSKSQLCRSALPCRICTSNSAASRPAALSPAIERPRRPPRHHSATASRSTSSSAARKAAASTVGPAAQPVLSLSGGMKSCCDAGRRQQRSTGNRTGAPSLTRRAARSEEHTSELQSHSDLVCRLLLEKKKKKNKEQREIDKQG